MCGRTRDLVIYFKFHRNPFRDFGAPGVKIWPLPLLWLLAFTTACTTVQAAINFVDATNDVTDKAIKPPLDSLHVNSKI